MTSVTLLVDSTSTWQRVLAIASVSTSYCGSACDRCDHYRSVGVTNWPVSDDLRFVKKRLARTQERERQLPSFVSVPLGCDRNRSQAFILPVALCLRSSLRSSLRFSLRSSLFLYINKSIVSSTRDVVRRLACRLVFLIVFSVYFPFISSLCSLIASFFWLCRDSS